MNRDTDRHMLGLLESAWAFALTDPDRSRQMNAEVLERLDAGTEPLIRGLALRNQACLDQFGSDLGRALELAMQAVTLLEGAEAYQDASSAHVILARVFARLGVSDRALEHGLRGLDLALEGGDDRAIGAARIDVAFLHLDAGNLEEAERLVMAVLESEERGDVGAGHARCLQILGRIQLARGECDGALLHFHKALDFAERSDISIGKLSSRQFLADTLVEAGRPLEAMARLLEACQLCRHLGFEGPLLRTLLRLARLHFRLDEPDAACATFEEILSRCESGQNLEYASEAHLGLADLCEKMGNPVDALRHLRASTRIEAERRQQESIERTRRLEFVARASAVQRELEVSSRILEDTLPASIVAEIKHHGRVRPIVHADTTVLFTDLVGFTKVAEHLGPEDLVASLDLLFGTFDAISSRWGIEKIKTIGDAYMACAGVPDHHPHHPAMALLAALEMREVIRKMARETLEGCPAWGIRIGLHTGSVLAGVIGKTKLAYDIWGDAVNTASRMESSGIPDHINVSEAVASRIEPYFVTERRGKVYAKNKGDLDMVFVHRLRPEWSADSEGTVPSADFLARLGVAPDASVASATP